MTEDKPKRPQAPRTPKKISDFIDFLREKISAGQVFNFSRDSLLVVMIKDATDADVAEIADFMEKLTSNMETPPKILVLQDDGRYKFSLYEGNVYTIDGLNANLEEDTHDLNIKDKDVLDLLNMEED